MEYNSPTSESVEDHKDSVREYNADPHPLIAATNPLVAQKHKLVLTHTIDSVRVNGLRINHRRGKSVKRVKNPLAMSTWRTVQVSFRASVPNARLKGCIGLLGTLSVAVLTNQTRRKVSDEAMPANAQVVSDERHSANAEMVLDEVSAPEHSQVVSSEQMLQYGDDLVTSQDAVVTSSHRVEATTSPQCEYSGILSVSANEQPNMNS